MESSFAVLLGRHRVASGLTQEALAERAQLSVGAIGSLERGTRRYPQRHTVEVLADALGLAGEPRDEFLAAMPRRRGRLRSAAGEPPGPRQLPAAVADFTGREAELKSLIEMFSAEPAAPSDPEVAGAAARSAVVAAVTGMGGIGKTALAVHLGHAVAANYPDGQLYLDLRGFGPDRPVPPIEALGYLLRALGTPADEVPHDVDEAAARFRSAVASRRLLVLLDNASDVAHVSPLLPGSSGSAVIVTSRRSLSTLPGAQHVQLSGLSEPDGLRLLRRLVGASRLEEEPASALEVVRACGALPLGIRLAGARLAARPDWPICHLAQRLGDEQHRLDELERDDLGVRTSFAVSIDQLADSSAARDRAAARAFTLLGLPDGPDVSLPVAARLLDLPERETERVLEHLADLYLVAPASPGRYRMHDLLRVYARELAAALPESERSAGLTRVLDLYVAAAWRTQALVQPPTHRRSLAEDSWTDPAPEFGSAREAIDWLEAERPHLLAAARQALAFADQLVVRLAIGLFGYYYTRRHWQDWAQVTRMALDHATEPIAVAQLRSDLGVALSRVAEEGAGDWDEPLALLRQSLADVRALGYRMMETSVLLNLNLVLGMAGQLEEAVECGELSRAINLADGNTLGAAYSCGNLAWAYGLLGERDKQLARIEEGIALVATGDGGDHAIAEGYRLLAEARREAGRAEQALADLRTSAELYERAGDLIGVADVLDQAGQLSAELGDHTAAVDHLLDALSVAEDCDEDGRRQASIHHHLGLELRRLGRNHEARTHLSQALAIYHHKNMPAANTIRELLSG